MNSLTRYSSGFPAGAVKDMCPSFSYFKRPTLNRLKPVQTGRFHLGLVCSPWRRVKFGLRSRPHSSLIGWASRRYFLPRVPFAERPVNHFNSFKRPRDSSREQIEKEGRLPIRVDARSSFIRLESCPHGYSHVRKAAGLIVLTNF